MSQGRGSERGGFPTTRWSAIVAARSADPAERARAMDALLAAYWKPVYKYIRVRWSIPGQDAQDLTQEFFARLIDKDLLESYDPSRARLRTFLRSCVDHLVANQARDEQRQKRGGGVLRVSLDFQSADGELKRLDPAVPAEMDEFFEREWARSVFSAGVERLRAELAAQNKCIYFRIFEQYDLLDTLPDGPDRRPTYRELAAELGLAASDVTNYLAYARREFRRLVLDFLREMTGSEDEFRRETRSLLGMDPAPDGSPEEESK